MDVFAKLKSLDEKITTAQKLITEAQSEIRELLISQVTDEVSQYEERMNRLEKLVEMKLSNRS